MEDNKKSKVIIIILVIALIGCISYIFYNNSKPKENNDNTPQEVIKEDIGKNKINNVNVDTSDLNDVLDLIGVSSKNVNENNNLLNHYVTSEDYKNNITEIISLYKPEYYLLRLPDKIFNSEICGAGASGCVGIYKEDVEKLYSMFNFDIENKECFKELDGMNEMYIFESISVLAFGGEQYIINHDISSRYLENNKIEIIDNQQVEIDNGEEKENKNQKVQYIFELKDGKYNDKYYALKEVKVD